MLHVQGEFDVVGSFRDAHSFDDNFTLTMSYDLNNTPYESSWTDLFNDVSNKSGFKVPVQRFAVKVRWVV